MKTVNVIDADFGIIHMEVEEGAPSMYFDMDHQCCVSVPFEDTVESAENCNIQQCDIYRVRLSGDEPINDLNHSAGIALICFRMKITDIYFHLLKRSHGHDGLSRIAHDTIYGLRRKLAKGAGEQHALEEQIATVNEELEYIRESSLRTL